MNTGHAQPSAKLTLSEVLLSIQSLYADGLKCFGRVLLKRLRERAAAAVAQAAGVDTEAVDPETMPKIDPKRLRKICSACPQLQVHAEDGREFSVFLRGHPCDFLDVCSAQDLYPSEMWLAAAQYFQSLSTEEMQFPGGRYACARVLARRSLPFLAGYSLGQVCHIVQLAISQKRILGYLGGALVPHGQSEEWVKEQHAFHQQPLFSGKDTGALPLASWEDARECLRELLNTVSNPEPGVVTLSNVKRLFRSHFQLELSETVLGHSRLFDLLQDARFHDVCVLQSHKNGQLLVKRADRLQPVPCHQLAPTHADPLLFTTPSPSGACPDLWNLVYMGSVVYPGASLEMDALPPNLAILKQVEVDLGMDRLWYGLPQQGASGSPYGRSDADFGCKQPSDSDFSTDVPLAPDIVGSSSDEGIPIWPQSPLEAQANAIRAEEEECVAACFRFQLDVPARHEDRKLVQREHIVKSTFIDIPKGSIAGARRRMQSVPKHVGS